MRPCGARGALRWICCAVGVETYEQRCRWTTKVCYPVLALLLAVIGLVLHLQARCRVLLPHGLEVCRVCRKAARVARAVISRWCRGADAAFEQAMRIFAWPVVLCLAAVIEGAMAVILVPLRLTWRRPCLACTALLLSVPAMVRVDHVQQHTTMVSLFGVPLAEHTSARPMWEALVDMTPRRARWALAIHAALSSAQMQPLQQAGSWLPLAQRAGHLPQVHALLGCLAVVAATTWCAARRVQFRISLARVQARCADLTVGESAAMPFPRRTAASPTNRIHAMHALMLIPPPVPHRRRLQACIAEMLEERV